MCASTANIDIFVMFRHFGVLGRLLISEIPPHTLCSCVRDSLVIFHRNSADMSLSSLFIFWLILQTSSCSSANDYKVNFLPGAPTDLPEMHAGSESNKNRPQWLGS